MDCLLVSSSSVLKNSSLSSIEIQPICWTINRLFRLIDDFATSLQLCSVTEGAPEPTAFNLITFYEWIATKFTRLPAAASHSQHLDVALGPALIDQHYCTKSIAVQCGEIKTDWHNYHYTFCSLMVFTFFPFLRSTLSFTWFFPLVPLQRFRTHGFARCFHDCHTHWHVRLHLRYGSLTPCRLSTDPYAS